MFSFHSVAVVQSLSCVWLLVTPWTAAGQISLSFTVSWNLLKLMSIEPVMPSTDTSCLQSFRCIDRPHCSTWNSYILTTEFASIIEKKNAMEKIDTIF